MLLVEKLKAFVGTRVGIQFWDSIMFMLDDEGPFPLEGDCKDVVLLQEGELSWSSNFVRADRLFDCRFMLEGIGW